jgi:hypothetical protein
MNVIYGESRPQSFEDHLAAPAALAHKKPAVSPGKLSGVKVTTLSN